MSAVRLVSMPDAVAGLRLRTRLALVAALVLSLMLGLVVPASATTVSTPGVTLTIDYGGDAYDGETVVEPGSTYTARLQYSVPQLTPGQVVTIDVPDGVTVPAAALVVPSGNTVVESLALNGDGDVVMTFKDPLDSNIDQGVITFTFEFDAPADGSGLEEITWGVDGEQSSATIIVKDSDDEFRPELTDSASKALASQPGLAAYISTDLNGDVTVDPDIEDVDITYVVTLESPEARSDVTVTDSLSPLLVFSTSLPEWDVTVTTWDEDGLNETEAPLSWGGSLSDANGTMTIMGLNLPAQSLMTLTYVAHVRSAASLEAALQALADDVDLATGGPFQLTLGNNATIDGFAVDAEFTVGSRIRTPGLGAAFAKSASLPSGGELGMDAEGALEADPDGVLDTPIDVNYTLRANLTPFAEFAGTVHELTRNVVITDTLPEQLRWNAAGDVVTATGGLVLAPASGACLVAPDFSDDLCVGQYTLSADGRTLAINVGNDTAGNYAILARAQLVSIDGTWQSITQEPGWLPQVETRYVARNTATFTFSDTRDGYSTSGDFAVTLPKAPGSVIDDAGEFSKSLGDDVVVAPGESAALTFTFAVAAGAVVDLRETRLIDTVDTDLFDLSDLGAILESITGSYAGQPGLTGADFGAEVVGGELVLTPSATFGSGLATPVAPDAELTAALTLSLTLTTFPIVGKQTIEVTNDARLEGSTFREYTWVSGTSGEATTFGDELELRKLLYAGDGAWTQNLRAELDGAGELVDDTYTYRIELIPHGGYFGVSIIPIDDLLPDGLEFLGFVADGALDTDDVLAGDTLAMGGNVQATWVAATGSIEIRQQAGTTLPEGTTASVNFAVRIVDHEPDVGITNSIGNASATVTPSTGFPLMVFKQDAVRPDLVITDRDARFTVTGPGGVVITDAAYVVDGRLVVEGADGGDQAIVVPADAEDPDAAPAGEYTVTETVAPAGYALADEPVVAVIAADGSSQSVTLYNDPLSLYAIGDRVWIDADADGLQDDGELPLEGVTVELLDDATGEALATATTDADGRYLFDLLEAGDYRVRFTLTDEQAQVWTLTEPDTGDDTSDSDAARATGETGTIALGADSPGLVAAEDYPYAQVNAINGVDPTWDAGVVARPGTVSVGDFVWIDEDADGVQDAGEPGLPRVVLTLVGPDGLPVTDVDGRVVGPQTTDADGAYLFGSLPVLADGETYTVSIDRDASATALEPYLPTRADGGDRETDSSLWSASSEGLTMAGESDLTLDFGFVRVPESGVEGSMPRTGAEPWPWILAATSLAVVGAGALVWRRRLQG